MPPTLSLRLLFRPHFIDRFLARIAALAPGEPAWEDNDADADWEACDPNDDELDDAGLDQDWWLGDGTEDDDDPSPQDDWPLEDEDD